MEQYELFYNSSKDGLFGYLLRMTGDYQLASDLVQESFTRYLRHYRGIGESSRSLLYTIARNAAMDAFRKPKNEQLESDYTDNLNNPEKTLDDRQRYSVILAAIGQMSIMDRELISLLAGADLSYAEIAQILNISESNVKVKVHRARVRLREILNQGGI